MLATFFSKKNSAIFELLLAANFWGFGFIATMWALESTGPLWITATRFMIATVLLLPILFLNSKTRTEYTISNFFAAILPGFFLSSCLILQTMGLQYTSATKSGFITCLYVIFVPIVDAIIFRKPINKKQALYIILAIIGMALITDIHKLDSLMNINYGDILTLLCAIASTFHIISVGYGTKKIRSAIVFNTFQAFWSMFLPLILALFIEKFSFTYSPKAFMGFIALIFGSTILAFMLQIRAQKYIDATTASMLFLLESPFAAFYAATILHEKINPLQWVGAIIILVSAFGCTKVSRTMNN